MRKKRNWHPGDFYHIYNRGNRLHPIFQSVKDRKIYLRFLEHSRLRFPFKLHAYSLMTNHIHLLIETINDPPHCFMHHVHSSYAQYFNREHTLVGHLFQGRYQALPIDTPEYFHQTGSYIHRNPFKAHLSNEAFDPFWSSYPFYISPASFTSKPYIVQVEGKKLLEYYPDPATAITQYRTFIEKNLYSGKKESQTTTCEISGSSLRKTISDTSSHPFDTPYHLS